MNIKYNEIKPALEDEIFIADNKTGSREYKPKEDARTHWEMEDNIHIQDTFGKRSVANLEEKELEITTYDVISMEDLLNKEARYADIYERPITQKTENGSEMIGWVRLFRTNPYRLQRYYREGILDERPEEYPILEIAYAKHPDKPKNIMKTGIAAELYRIYDLTKEKEPDLTEQNISYNNLCKLRIVATVEQELYASQAILDDLGFTKKGDSAFYLEGEVDYSDFEETDTELVGVYELDWNKFMQNIDKQVIESARNRNNNKATPLS